MTDLFTKREIIELLECETDILITDVSNEKCWLAHAPLDVEAELVSLFKSKMFLTVSNVCNVVASQQVLGGSAKPLYDSDGNWTHVIVGN